MTAVNVRVEPLAPPIACAPAATTEPLTPRLKLSLHAGTPPLHPVRRKKGEHATVPLSPEANLRRDGVEVGRDRLVRLMKTVGL